MRESRRFLSETGFGIQHGPIFTCLNEYPRYHGGGTAAEKPGTSSYDHDECSCSALYEESGKCTEEDVDIAEMKKKFELGYVRTAS